MCAIAEYAPTKTGVYLSDIRQFSNRVCYKKYLKHNKHNSLHLEQIFAQMFLLGHNLFLKAWNS